MKIEPSKPYFILQVFFDRNIVSPPRQISWSCGRDSSRAPTCSFFSIPYFQNLGLKVVSLSRKDGLIWSKIIFIRKKAKNLKEMSVILNACSVTRKTSSSFLEARNALWRNKIAVQNSAYKLPVPFSLGNVTHDWQLSLLFKCKIFKAYQVSAKLQGFYTKCQYILCQKILVGVFVTFCNVPCFLFHFCGILI